MVRTRSGTAASGGSSAPDLWGAFAAAGGSSAPGLQSALRWPGADEPPAAAGALRRTEADEPPAAVIMLGALHLQGAVASGEADRHTHGSLSTPLHQPRLPKMGCTTLGKISRLVAFEGNHFSSTCLLSCLCGLWELMNGIQEMPTIHITFCLTPLKHSIFSEV